MTKLLFLLFVISFSSAYSQNGKIYPKSSQINYGKENIYIYEPQKGLVISENAKVNVVYKPLVKRSVPLLTKENGYEFALQVPDSIDVIIMTIADKKNNVIDNNSDKGFVVFLKNKTREEIEKSKLSQIFAGQLGNYLLGLKISPDEFISQYEELFQLNPKFKDFKEEIYNYNFNNYLYLKYSRDGEKAKPEIMGYAEKLIKNGDERSLQRLSFIYSILKMNDKYDELQNTIVNKYPKGETAKEKYISKFYSNNERSEQFVLDEMQKYIDNFNDNSDKSKNPFYVALLNIYLKNKDTVKIAKYENLINDKLQIAFIYNEFAWKLSGEELSNEGKDIDFAEKLSEKSLAIVRDRLKDDEYNANLQSQYYTFEDTYALIMYKRGQYDIAFKYQDDYIQHTDGLYLQGNERYAAYAEKAKGPAFAKDYLEQQLRDGVDSKVMTDQLKEIYKKLNLPLKEFDKLKENSKRLVAQKTKEEIIKTYGSVKAIDFTLTNLEGKSIKLSDYKGKLVVLDFWATWCGPCRASFPHMQELVNKYNNKNVEFFFIDVWERKQPVATKEVVTKFVNDNKYSFNVLFDYKDEIVAKYKVEGIPTKIVIDKEGNIISINSSAENLVSIIDENI